MSFLNPWTAAEWLVMENGWPWRWPGYFTDITANETDKMGNIRSDKMAEEEKTSVTESDKKTDEALDTIYDAMEQFFKASGMHGSLTMTRNGKTRHYEFGDTKDTEGADSKKEDAQAKAVAEKQELYNKLVKIEKELSETKNIIQDTVAKYNKMVDEHNEILLKYQYKTGPSLGYLPQQTHIKLYF